MSTVETEVSEESDIYQSVIETIAIVEDVAPTDLSPPLYEIVDPDALETLFTDGQTLGKVVFNYGMYEVSVFSDGYVSLKNRGTRLPSHRE